MKQDNSIWLKIGLTYFVILTIFYIPIVLLNIFPSNYSYEDVGYAVIIEHGVFNKELIAIEKNAENEQQIAMLKYHIHSIHSLVVLGVPLLSFICVGFLFQFSKRFKMIKGIEASRKRAVALLLMTTIILLWLGGEFFHRRGNILASLAELVY
ncbi:hypothetical protein BKP35_11750 [Anaerobacillus arseniciselenatis]|uniref:Uncharacterized protein n=1 Tax=Anaerobacillus arseniciselenatis TaxID=85682 RepID=A0A1S2LIU0_9BACI|nr:hypothetical protein [Anaerobacillus arseniciselenatis]OIJ11607.1 hypothetical protein BKP35_11750 [Anaerobacillus arseniciselenatis]